MPLDPDLTATYERDGIVRLPGAFIAWADRLLAAIDRVIARSQEPGYPLDREFGPAPQNPLSVSRAKGRVVVGGGLRFLVVGGENQGGVLATTLLQDSTHGVLAGLASQPLDPPTAVAANAEFELQGTGFLGFGDASGGGAMSSASNVPKAFSHRRGRMFGVPIDDPGDDSRRVLAPPYAGRAPVPLVS